MLHPGGGALEAQNRTVGLDEAQLLCALNGV